MTHPPRWSLALAAVLAPVAVRAQDPPIRLKLSAEVFAPGERVKVRVKLVADGYLVVLRADAQGRVRVLFPVDPQDSGVVRGGKELSLRGRGDREGFQVDDRDGAGVVLAARADAPFDFQAFTRAAHWDYRALAAADSAPDGEAALLDVVDRMAGGDYDFDVVTYAVSDHGYGRRAGGWRGPVWPCWGCRPWYGPLWYRPWYRPWYGSRIWIGGAVVVGPRYIGRRWR